MFILDKSSHGSGIENRVLSAIKTDKRGLSNLVAYVLLISITLSLSVMVYGWLKNYTKSDKTPVCPDNVNVIVGDYHCAGGVNGNITVDLENKGLFDVGGFVVRVSDKPNAKFGIYTLDSNGIKLGPGDSKKIVYKFKDYTTTIIKNVTLLDVQPYILKDGKVACDTYTSQKIVCS